MGTLPTIPVAVAEIEHGDDEDLIVHLPGKYEICSTCNGTGGHSRRFGVITESNRDQWDDESWENYMTGVYDEPCEDCDNGKVVVIDHDRIVTAAQKAALAVHKMNEQIDRELDAEQAAEMRYCYGPNF